jgi:spore germination protein YaaH
MQVAATLQLVPVERRASWRMHRVESGETLAEIGKHFGVAASSIVTANNLHSQEMSEGDRLLIPAASRPEPVAKRPVSHTATRRATTTGRSTTTHATTTQGTTTHSTHRTATRKPAQKKPVTIAKN